MTELDELLALREKLLREVDSGQRTVGGGSIGPAGTTMWGNEPIMRAANPDGAEAVLRIDAIATHVRAQADRIGELERGLVQADEALCEYACHGGPSAPCIRTPEQCRSDCGKDAGDALLAARALLSASGEPATGEG